jgi:class 3 adenylate cyclase
MMAVQLETVTVLFTDLVGSTELASRVGPERAEELRQEHFTILRQTVAAANGREVKNTGDGLMVAFSSAAAAVQCAKSMQQRMELRNRRTEPELWIRVGISMGDATREGADYFGAPVVEAARLCATADAGQVLLSDVTRVMVGRRGDHIFAPVGELDLKGLPEPVAACELVWEGLPAATVPLPDRLQVLPATSFVGREEQRELLNELWEQSRSGQRQVVLLTGEPGIGKTRLASYAALAAHAEGAIVLCGHCDEDLNVPYRPWIEALRDLVALAPATVLEAHVEKHGGELTRLVPEMSGRIDNIPAPRESDPETERFLLFGAITDLLQTASAANGLVLLLDDLHWADKPSLLLLKHLICAGAGMHVMVLGTYRDTDLQVDHPLTALLADLRSVQGCNGFGSQGSRLSKSPHSWKRSPGMN